MMAILRRMLWLALIAAVVWVASWRPQAVAEPQSAGSTAVRTAPAGLRVGATPGKKGATDYWLEAQTARLTAKYSDGTVAVAGRGTDGNFETRVTDWAGSELARFTVSRVGADGGGSDAVLRYTPRTGDALHVYGESTVRPTLAWANTQAYSLSKDGPTTASSLEWRNGLMRRRGAVARDVERQLSELHTEWSGGLSVRTRRGTAVNLQWNNQRALNGEMLVSRLIRDGVQLGEANWFTKEQVLIWNIPGVTAGSLTAEQMKTFGGWPFTPDAEWLNLQTLAFYHFKTAMDKQGTVAAARTPAASRTRQVLDWLVAPVQADEPGCDGLHWLDGTVLRFCCDVHDRCYQKYGCSSSSWWQFWSSWTCDACNLGAVFCFVSGGAGRGPFHPFPF